MAHKYKAIVMGCSAGGLSLMKELLPALPSDFTLPIIIVQHISANSDNIWVHLLNTMSRLHIKEINEKDLIQPGNVYVAPPNYHVLVENDETFSLSVDEKVNYARPSIDVLFESASHVYKDQLIGIVFTGSNHDGAAGLRKIKEGGGLTIVQEPSTAEYSSMPLAAIAATKTDHILPLEKIIPLLINLSNPIHP
ncbi:MAG: chemotaxis protein-glutamate methylesterase [Bacteroidetes bacterium]|jgi:two-component system chemotaxis response regulator CheB|nr:chemotaxis protein-glutamate methylesterase [Bacteroidota bacterium]